MLLSFSALDFVPSVATPPCRYMLLARRVTYVSNDEIFTMMHKPGQDGQIPSNIVVLQMAMRELKKASSGVEWIAAFLKYHFYDHAYHVVTYLGQSDTYKASLSEQLLLHLGEKILAKFSDVLTERLKRANKHYQDYMRTFDQYRPVDAMRKRLMLLILTECHTMIIPKHTLWPNHPEVGVLSVGDKTNGGGEGMPTEAQKLIGDAVEKATGSASIFTSGLLIHFPVSKLYCRGVWPGELKRVLGTSCHRVISGA